MSKELVYLDEGLIFIPKKLLVHMHSQLKLIVVHKNKRDSYEAISKYLSDFLRNSFKNNNEDLFHYFNSLGIALSDGTVERAIKGQKGTDKHAVKYELLDLICYCIWEKSFLQILFSPEFDWGKITEYSIHLPKYAIEEKNELIKTGVITPKSAVHEKFSNELKSFAHKIYIELTTRKAAIPIDIDNDIIEEIYNSWYKLFCIIRDELKILPVECYKDQENPNSPVSIALKILNDILRPHLTEYQAKFRNWMENERLKPENKSLSPQELQKRYLDYSKLILSLKEVNNKLITLSGEMMNCL